MNIGQTFPFSSYFLNTLVFYLNFSIFKNAVAGKLPVPVEYELPYVHPADAKDFFKRVNLVRLR